MRYIKYIVLIIICAFLISYIINHLDDFKLIANIHLFYIPHIIIFIIIFNILNSIQLKYLLQFYNIDIKIFDSFAITCISCFLNIILPMRGGAGYRAVYLKRNFGLNYSDFILSFLSIYVVTFGIGAILSLFFFYPLLSTNNGILVKIFLIFTILGFLYLTLFNVKTSKFFPKFINKTICSWQKLNSNKLLMLKIYLITFINYILIAVILFFEFNSFMPNLVSLVESFYYSIFSVFSLFVSITPGSLGIREVFLMYCSTLLDIKPIYSINVSIIDRILGFLTLFFLSAFFVLFYNKKFSLRLKNN